MKKNLHLKRIDILYPFIITLLLMLVVLFTCNITPFGPNSLAIFDANIQYLDFYGFLKNVLSGNGSLGYSFSKTLGGNFSAVYSYYLTSPFAFLVLFFPKSSFHLFFTCLICLKLSLASSMFYLFLIKRFNVDQCNKKTFIFFLLSIGYGLSNYTLTQSSNIMWIDGVYMLPLILLGTYRVIQGDKIYKLSIPTALSIIFNWYSGGINCLFSFFWFLFEICLSSDIDSIKILLDRFFKYILSMLIGVLLSSFIFLPTVFAMLSGNRGTFDLNYFKYDVFIGDVISIIQGMSINSYSDSSHIALYCGSLGFIGWIYTTFFSDISNRIKATIILFSFLCVLMFYWQPFYFIFSLLKHVGSYWCRYAYIGISFILFVSAYGLIQEKNNRYSIFYSCLTCSLLLLGTLYLLEANRKLYVLITIFFIVGSSLLLYGYNNVFHKKRTFKIALICFVILEMSVNSFLIMDTKKSTLVPLYQTYSEKEDSMFKNIKESDSSFYRINQTSTKNQFYRNSKDDKFVSVQATYNESLNYDFWSISGYTSSPDDIQRYFLDRVGYRINGENMCIVNTSQIAVDSFLGVKYIVSNDDINGLKKIDYDSTLNKTVYKNKYSLPLVFTVSEKTNGNINKDVNNFEYQNLIYKELSQTDTEVLNKLEYAGDLTGDKNNAFSQEYKVNVLEGEYVYYGNIPWNKYMYAKLNVNNIYDMDYACWLSSGVFYIPTNEKKDAFEINISSDLGYYINDSLVQFYGLDLHALDEITQSIRNNSHVKDYKISDGLVTATIESKEDEKVFLSVPYDKGWTCTVNGEKVKPELFADCFYLIPVKKGTNQIMMKYTVPGFKKGIILTISGIALLILMSYLERRRT